MEMVVNFYIMLFSDLSTSYIDLFLLPPSAYDCHNTLIFSLDPP